MSAPPPDMKAAFEPLGLELPAEGQPVNLMELMAKGFQKIKQTKKRRQSSKRKPAGEIVEVYGEAPEQYPSYDEDW